MKRKSKTARNYTATSFSSSTVSSPAFTIVELLVVIVIIGILAAITIISYAGVTQKATIATLKADLDNNSKLLKSYYTLYDSYPTALDSNNCPTAPTINNEYCLKAGSDITLTYEPSSTTKASEFALYATKNNLNYRIASDTGLSSNSLTKVCPYGFIVVPGSSTYGTSDFCVMKYEAKADDNGDGIGDTTQTTGYNTWPANTYPISSTRKLVSTAAGYPVANISQTTAITAAANYTTGCTGTCQLITEAQWMTIAQNVLSQPQNWSSGTVGTGYIYNGHVNNNPVTALEASTSDTDSLYGITGGTGTTSNANNKRTLALSNGEVIWDMAGNILEWTQGQTTGNQPGTSGESGYAWHEWNGVAQNGFPSASMPTSMASGTLSNITSWTGTNGIGRVNSYYGETGARGFRRSGFWSYGGNAGVLFLGLSYAPSDWNYYVGLRAVAL